MNNSDIPMQLTDHNPIIQLELLMNLARFATKAVPCTLTSVIIMPLIIEAAVTIASPFLAAGLVSQLTCFFGVF
jgi:hypothetical protein